MEELVLNCIDFPCALSVGTDVVDGEDITEYVFWVCLDVEVVLQSSYSPSAAVAALSLG